MGEASRAVRERHRRGLLIVVFGWMTVLSVKRPTHAVSLLGFVDLPVNLAPFGSLLFTSVIVPKASFVGHLAASTMGYFVAWDLFAWMDWYWTGVLAFWVIVGFFSSLKTTTDMNLPFIRVLGSAGAGGDAFSGTDSPRAAAAIDRGLGTATTPSRARFAARTRTSDARRRRE